MKFQRNTIILVISAALLGGFVYFSEVKQPSTSGPTATESKDPIFDFEEGQIQALQVKTASQTLSFERDKEENWQLKSPQSGRADDASVAFLLNLLTTTSKERPLQVEPDQTSDFGFDQPLATVTVTLEDGNTHTVILGGKDFSGGSIYAQVDPPQVDPSQTDPSQAAPESLEIVLVPNTF
ncbi:MAG: DUF4340 domain-containing protein, partial [Cyanothece sp. SIO1E1]|nr:DUF4340 domain-containing protein [Cyanothece sp. SIO1E1]